MEFIFWVSAACILYIYLGYPALIALCAAVKRRPVKKGPFHGTCSVAIAAYNEQENLQQKIASLLAAEDAEKIKEIIIGSDGSTDQTATCLQQYEDRRVQCAAFEKRRGKPAVLNDILPHCSGDVVVLTDARQELEPTALRELLANFTDPEVGVVSGELQFRREAADSSAAQGVNIYWEYEKFIRERESRVDSVPGATGALYAIRRELISPLHPDTLLDDVAIPMQAVLQGKRCIFEPDAVIFDNPSKQAAQETRRKRRTIAGNAQLVRLYPQLLNPLHNPIWFQFVSHKILRLAAPLCMVLAMAANIALIHRCFYAALLSLHLLFYLAGAAGGLLQKMGKTSSLLGAPYMFIRLNWTTAQALWDALTGRYQVKWDCTAHLPT